MIRVLHLMPTEADFETRRTSDALTRDIGGDFAVQIRTLGHGGDSRNVPIAALDVRRTHADVIHAWGTSALTAAAISGSRPVVFTPDRFLKSPACGWVSTLAGYRNIHMVCPTATQRQIAMERGIPAAQCHLIRPGVDFSRISKPRNDALRAALGLSPDDFVLLAAGESTRPASHEEAVWAVSILHVLDPRYKLLLWGRGLHTRSAATLGRRLRQPELIRVAESSLQRPFEFEELLPAADAALVTARSAVPTLPIAICMAAGLPIVSTVTRCVTELLRDQQTAFMVPRPSPRLITQRVLDLGADAQLQNTIAQNAETQAAHSHSVTGMLDQYCTIYRQLAGAQCVELSAPPVDYIPAAPVIESQRRSPVLAH